MLTTHVECESLPGCAVAAVLQRIGKGDVCQALFVVPDRSVAGCHVTVM